MKVRVAAHEAFYYPDVLLTCDPHDCRIGIAPSKLLHVADLDIGRDHPGPLGAAAEKPPTAAKQPGRVKGVPRNRKLLLLSVGQGRADHE